MNTINEILVYLIQTVLGIYLLIMLMRFILQLSLADFYNPICQFLVRATNPIVVPMRRLIPARGRLDFASLLLAVVIQLLGIAAMLLLNGAGLPPVSLLLAWSVIGVIGLLVKIYFFALLGMIILSWIAPGTSNPAAYLMFQITEPVMAPFRKMLPSMGGMDFSPILVFIIINIVQIALRNFAAGLGLHPALVMGI
ncbi:YggT family protein [Congregibacter variabilis]|uniref:YggT family protein n=1 Tax=Congregibacter variabilis TaxID=3081200 RepID=A0ABZ0I0Q9_9GAMM|nr:YggT family protein [Congregibacter sp. IMCC43200]